MKLSRIGPCILMLSCTIPGWQTAMADVVDSSASGFSISISLEIVASPDQVYRQLVNNIHRWWESAHTFSGDASNLYIEEKATGCFCERLPGGGSVRHLQVVYADPGKTLRLQGGLGPLQAMAVAGSMTWKVTATEPGTLLHLTYNVTGYAPVGLLSLAGPVNTVLTAQAERLKRYIETGSSEATTD